MRLLSFVFAFTLSLPAQARRENFHVTGDPNIDGYNIRQGEMNQGRHHEWTVPGLGSTSVCIEVDTATGGERHRVVMIDSYCPKVTVVHAWTPPEAGLNSRCQKIDQETRGKKFRRLEKEELCRKPPVTNVWLVTDSDVKPRCYEIDVKTQGQKYRRPLQHDRCAKVLDPYVAFGRKEPLFNQDRKPASLAKPVAEEDISQYREELIYLPLPEAR